MKMKLFKHFNLLCLLFGHDWDCSDWVSRKYVPMNNGTERFNKKTKRRRKKEVITYYKKCLRCGKFEKRYTNKKYH